MEHVALADWAVIVIYLAAVILLGSLLGRGQKNTRDYFLGSRNIPWWGVSLSIIATETSALTFIGIPAFAFGNDLTFIQVVIGFIIARLILAVVMVPHYFKGDIYSPYELFAKTFGESSRRTAAGFFLISGTLAAGVRVYVTCIPIQLMFGFKNEQIIWAILLFVGLSLSYTYLGGIKAVIWTDAIQFFLFTAGGIFVLLFIPTQLEGGWSQMIQLTRDADKWHWFNGEFSLSMPYNIWMGFLGATVLSMSTHGVDQLVVQRVLSCRNVVEGRKALVLSAVIILPLFLLFLLVGIFLWAFYQQSQFAIPIPELRPGVGKNDYVFPIFMLTELPVGIKGLLIVGVLSAAMSSVSSALSALASVSTMDIAKGWFGKNKDEAFYFKLSKQVTLFWAFVLVLVAWISQQTASILNLAFSLSGLTNGALLGGLALSLMVKKRNPLPLIIGMMVSLLMMIVIHFGSKTDFWTSREWIQIAWPWYTLIGTAITLAVYCLAEGRVKSVD